MTEACEFTPDLSEITQISQIDPELLSCVRVLKAIHEQFGDNALTDTHTRGAYLASLSASSMGSKRVFECQTDGCAETYVQTPQIRRGFATKSR